MSLSRLQETNESYLTVICDTQSDQKCNAAANAFSQVQQQAF